MSCPHTVNGRCLLCEREAGAPTEIIPVSQPKIGELERQYLQECLTYNQLTHGPMVNRFEALFAETLRVKHAVMCSNGTTALHLALLAAGVGPGDQVLVPDLTFVATANAVMHAGAVPILVDIDPVNWGMSLLDAQRKVTSYTKAVIPVHLYGNPMDMGSVLAFAESNRLVVIEDAAEGLGGSWNGRPLGSHGAFGTFSFYGNKVLTTGEGGAVVTNHDDYARLARLYRGQGQHPSRRYFHNVVGYNYRMTDLQAAIGLGQLYALPENLELRWRITETYYDRFSAQGFDTVQPYAAPWLFTFILPESVNREEVQDRLLQMGIDTRPAFVPLHRMPMYEGRDADFPESCRVGARGLSLPTYPGLRQKEVNDIIDATFDVISDLIKEEGR